MNQPTKQQPPPLSQEAFIALVTISPDGCWLWNGKIDQCGYGRLTHEDPIGKPRRATGAHRVACLLFKGPIQPGLEVDHLCFNRRCVNPDHLEIVTHAENIKRSWDRGERQQSGRRLRVVAGNQCRRGHLLTDETILVYGKFRWCRACQSEGQRERQRKRRALLGPKAVIQEAA